jgi:hypothetical protein
MDLLGKEDNFDTLSIRDLIEARDLYHYHLINKANVVGTAIGRYLIRKSEPWSGRKNSSARKRKTHGERRFDNSEVRDYSWPCVLVLVRAWEQERDFTAHRGKLHPTDMIPKRLYLPDGRVVPVCVVKVNLGEQDEFTLPDWQWPQNLLGGGLPIEVTVQGVARTATVGCLVSDGHTTYALTNRHVCGRAGDPVYGVIRGKRIIVGRASDKQLTRLPFSEVYPDFLVKRTFVNLDIGLVEVDDISDWTSQVYGIGPVGPLADLNENNLSLRLIGAAVLAHGAASGQLQGEIKALFCRYKTVGGYEYVSDFLVAPNEAKGLQTRPGDSGAIWHLAPGSKNELPLPLAIEWGGQELVGADGSSRFHFALATSLSNVCKILDVELVLDHNTGVLPYWGQTGHYSIASFACQILVPGKLSQLMTANINQISFEIAKLTPKEISRVLQDSKKNGGLVPLADVPDIIWKNLPGKVTGGRDVRFAGSGRSTGPEHPTHFADVDEPRPGDGKTLRQLSLENPQANLTVDSWRTFFDETGHTEQRERGLLPFRVWQFYDAMVDALASTPPKVDEFLCAAGLLCHYVGDACQPLHGSMFSDGFSDQTFTVERHHRDGTPFEETSHVGAGVHSAYESNMIDRHAPDLLKGIAAKISSTSKLKKVGSGFGVALATVQLMDRSARKIHPKALIKTFVDAGGSKTVAVYDDLWDKFGAKTIGVMTDGARVLAMIWESAWAAAGNGNKIGNSALGAVDPKRLIALYTDATFVPSLDLDHIGPSLKGA